MFLHFFLRPLVRNFRSLSSTYCEEQLSAGIGLMSALLLEDMKMPGKMPGLYATEIQAFGAAKAARTTYRS